MSAMGYAIGTTECQVEAAASRPAAQGELRPFHPTFAPIGPRAAAADVGDDVRAAHRVLLF
jgi:hypothetical protein